MIKRIIQILFGIFASNASEAQVQEPVKTKSSSEMNQSYIEVFDNIVYRDETKIDISNYNGSNNQEIKASKELIYDNSKDYDSQFNEKVICTESIPEESKLKFVKDALKDSNKNIFKHLYGSDCPCLKTQPKLSQLFYDHFKEISQKTSDRYEKYQFLQFVTKNELDDDLELINRYFKDRNNLEDKFRGETKLPINLIRKGKIKEALNLVEMFVNDHKNGVIKSIHDGSHYEKENVFALLYFNGNEQIRKKTLDLAFDYYNRITRGYTYSLSLFLKQVDPKRYNTSIENWLSKYEEMDTTIYSNNNGYCSLLGSDGRIIAEKEGINYWNKYLQSEPRWKDSNVSFEQSMLDIAEACMKGISNNNDKEAILNYILQNHRYFKSDETFKDSRYLNKFLSILYISNTNISEERIESYLPERYKQYGTWKYAWKEIIAPQNNLKQMELEEKIGIYVKHGFNTSEGLDEYDKFIYSIGRLHDYDLIRETGNTIWFDTEGGMFPLDYKELFNSTFLPVLISNNIEDIGIEEIQTIIEGQCTYQIKIDNKKQVYQFEFTNRSDWYEVKPFIKAINLALKDIESELRLIYLDSQDQTTLLGLFNPNKFVPLAKEINMYSYAVDYNDGLMKNDYR